jgi:hypothetical protein
VRQADNETRRRGGQREREREREKRERERERAILWPFGAPEWIIISFRAYDNQLWAWLDVN